MRKEQKIFYLLFLFSLFHSLMIVSLFLRRKNINLFCSYSIISSLFKQFGFRIKHNKSEIFYFSRLTKNDEFPLLDLGLLRGFLWWPKDKWKYLGFILIGNFLFINIFTSMPTKLCLPLKAWKCWGILQEICYLHTNNYSIEHPSCLLYFMVSNYCITKEHLSSILSNN